MTLKKVREGFFHHRPKEKTLLQVLHKSHGLGKMSKQSFATVELLHFWSDLGKFKISHSWSVQMTFLMSQMITRQKYLSNVLSFMQFGNRKTSKSCLQQHSAFFHPHYVFFDQFWEVEFWIGEMSSELKPKGRYRK